MIINRSSAYNFKVRIYFNDIKQNGPYKEFIDVGAVNRNSSDYLIHKRYETWRASIDSVKKIEIII